MYKSYIVDDDYNDSRLDKWFKNKVINLPFFIEKYSDKIRLRLIKKLNHPID